MWLQTQIKFALIYLFMHQFLTRINCIGLQELDTIYYYRKYMRNTENNYSMLLKHLALNVKNARVKNNFRQSDMIEFGFSERFIQKIESGNYSPNLYTIHRLAEALNTTVDKLFKINSSIK